MHVRLCVSQRGDTDSPTRPNIPVTAAKMVTTRDHHGGWIRSRSVYRIHYVLSPHLAPDRRTHNRMWVPVDLTTTDSGTDVDVLPGFGGVPIRCRWWPNSLLPGSPVTYMRPESWLVYPGWDPRLSEGGPKNPIKKLNTGQTPF